MGGSVVRFECVDFGETSSSGNDRITQAVPTTATLASYKNINFNAHVPRYEAVANQAQVLNVAVPVDLNQVTFKDNNFWLNFVSGGASLVDIKGAPRVSFTGDEFIRNGDSFKEVIEKSWFSGVITRASNEMTWSQGFANNAIQSNGEKLMRSLINLERSTQLTMTGTKF
jgi:hypothetical protein